MKRKGSPRSDLTEADVANIRELVAWRRDEIKRINSIAGPKALAEKFEVSTVTIHKIGTYRTW